MKLTKIHRVLTFQQSPWLKEYIDFNTEKRKQAANDFEKDFFKLLNNAVFGKTMENLRNRVNIELVTTEKRLHKLTKAPSFNHFRIFTPEIAGVNLKKTTLYLNRPIYAGFTTGRGATTCAPRCPCPERLWNHCTGASCRAFPRRRGRPADGPAGGLWEE